VVHPSVMETGDTTGWHRKWVIVLGVLGWLFLYRYRVMGWLLSKAVTFQLSTSRSRNASLAPVTVRVERVSLQPLCFYNVELSSSGSNVWRIKLTKVAVQSHVKEFFESFGLVKICILAIDEIVGDVDKVDEVLLKDALLPKKGVALNAAGSTRRKFKEMPGKGHEGRLTLDLLLNVLAKQNPICYMRFVDLKVERIRLRVNCLETRSLFLCQGLYVGVTDVFVQREMFQLKVQAQSLVMQSSPQTEDPEGRHQESDGSDGIRLEVPDASALLDLHLRSQHFLGCKVHGCEAQTTSLVISTVFLERMLSTRNELMRRGLSTLSGLKSSSTLRSPESAGPAASPAPASPSKIEISDLHLCVTIVDDVETIGCVPVQFRADVRELTYSKQLESPDANATDASDSTDADSIKPGEARVSIETLVQNVRANVLGDAEIKLLSVHSIEVRARQTSKIRGVIAGTFEKVECVLNRRAEKICRSLEAVQERAKRSQNEAKNMIQSALTRRPSASASDKVVRQERGGQIHWDAEIEVTCWMLAFGSIAENGGANDFTAYGSATSIQTPSAPVVGEHGSSYIKRYIETQNISVDVALNGVASHSATFGVTKATLTTSVDPSTSTKTAATAVKFDYVSINGLSVETSEEPDRFPAIYLLDVKIDREEKASVEFTEVSMSIGIDSTTVKWDYQAHRAFLAEWAEIKGILEQLELLLASPSKTNRLSGGKSDQPVKIVGTNVYSKDTTIDVVDIPGVAALATIGLVDARVNHRATQLSVTMAFSSARAGLRWGDRQSTIELTDASVQNRSSLGRQRYLTKVPTQSDIRCSLLKMHLRPQSRMLLLFLRLDQLTSSSGKDDIANRPSVQGISFACDTLLIELEGEQSREQAASINLGTFGVKMTRCTPREITQSLVRLAQCLGKDGFAGRSFAEVAQQVVVMEGTASASTIRAAIPSKKLVELQDTEMHFSITDVEWSRLLPWGASEEDEAAVSRTLGFDLCLLTERIHLAMEKIPFETFMQLVPIIQEAFETKEPHAGDDVEARPDQTSFRLRYAGNLDVAFQEAQLVSPYGDKDGREQIGSKVTRVLLGELALNLRQFQTLRLKCAPLRVLLEDAASSGTTDVGVPRGEDSLQLLYVPEVSVNTIIHWRQGIHDRGQLQYGLSLEIAIGNVHSNDTPAQVPLADEALVAINWDCVYPWLIFMTTDDDGDLIVKKPSEESSIDPDEPKRLQCIGVQWDLSVSVIQIAWWDTATQDTGMLLIANELLTHGVLRSDRSVDTNSKELRRWKLWEATVYLHLFRGYLLHVEDDFAAAEEAIPDVLPFGSEMSSNFSLETVGTSYRNTYSPLDGEDWDALDDEVTAMFAPSSSMIFEKLHDAFVPIDYEFAIVNPPKAKKEAPPSRPLPMLHVPVSVRTSSAAISPPKSPRSAKNWTHNIRNRLSRLKRRSASMDNLFLKDGSCPIQVDAMRLLWTIQTRDSIFYMVATTLDSLQLLLDAQRSASSAETDGPSTEAIADPFAPRREKKSSLRSPCVVSDAAVNDPIVETPRLFNRRGSTRDTLLELLQQGKLGMAQDLDRESSSKSMDDDSSSSRGSIGEEASDFDAPPKVIALKAYTVDIHDAQINVREENTRSNMLLASKHIHFEIGADAGESNTIANLTFDNVTAHVAPIDVDISAGVLWYSHSDVGSPSGSGSTLLKQIMDECSLTSAYTNSRSTGATSTEVDLSFLQLSTDRHQFYQLMNVIRHVLLAPPSIARRPKRTYTPRTYSTEAAQQQGGSEFTVFVPPSPTPNAPLAATTSTKKLHVLLEEELRNREIRTRGTSARSKAAMCALKSISFKVVGMQWRLRLSPEVTGADHEFVGIRIQGFTGCHTYFTNHNTKLTLNLQWLEVSNLHPGPSSAPFEDPTAVLKAKLLVDKRFESSSKLALGSQQGMLVVRAESGPVVRIHGQKLRVLEVLEVSMFPEISNMIVIQLAADFYELIYKFFFENISPAPASTQNSEQVFFGRKSTYGPASPTSSTSNVAPSQRGSSSPFTKSRVPPASPVSSQPSLRPLRKTNSAGSTNNMLQESSSSSIAAAGPNSPTSASSSEEIAIPDDSDSTTDDCELFYVKYVRMGNVRLRINCNGFFVNLSHFDLDLPPYVCQSKLCTTKKLLQKFESHLKWYITKESASSGLSQFKNKLLKWTPSSSSTDSKKDKSKKQEEDTAAANAQVLFGPYSGTPT
jgi:hypothetical protein